jgi:hypothetical protein
MDVVDLNEAALKKMRQQKLGEASLILETALGALQEIYSGDWAPKKRSRETREDPSFKLEEDDCVGVVQSVGEMLIGEDVTSSIPRDNVLFFYDRAFKLSNPRWLDFDLVENQSSLCSILLYNLALVHHIKAIKTGNTYSVKEALHCYRNSHIVLERAKDDVPLQRHILLLMGLLNNMGHVHATLFELYTTDQCIRWLSCAIVSNQILVLEDVDFEFFYSNLNLIPKPHNKFAPAA